MTKDEALDLALRSLKELVPDESDYAPAIQGQRKRQEKAITAIKQARSAPVQEPVGYVAENGVVDWNVCAPPILTDLYTTPPAAQRQWFGLTEREIELLDGMIEVQLDHAKRCDSIANRTMAEKQKGWDMERVALLKKLKENT
jgi:hypothetical protein